MEADLFTHGAKLCPGCSGCTTNLTDGDLAYELELEAMMSERPDGNSGPPATSFSGWHISPNRMVPTRRGKGADAVTHVRRVSAPMDIDNLAQRTFAALSRSREV